MVTEPSLEKTVIGAPLFGFLMTTPLGLEKVVCACTEKPAEAAIKPASSGLRVRMVELRLFMTSVPAEI